MNMKGSFLKEDNIGYIEVISEKKQGFLEHEVAGSCIKQSKIIMMITIKCAGYQEYK